VYLPCDKTTLIHIHLESIIKTAGSQQSTDSHEPNCLPTATQENERSGPAPSVVSTIEVIAD